MDQGPSRSAAAASECRISAMSSAQPFRSILTIAAALTVVVWSTTLVAQTAAPAQTPAETFTAYRKALAGA